MYDDTWMAGPPEAYTIHGGLIRTQSRGSLRLRSADPTAPAVMDPRALSAGADVDALTASVALCREIARQPALAEWTARELYPGPEVRTDAELRDYVRRVTGSYHHQVGTCRMVATTRPSSIPSCGSTASGACGWPTRRSCRR
jgi:choline dehydrogenase